MCGHKVPGLCGQNITLTNNAQVERLLSVPDSRIMLLSRFHVMKARKRDYISIHINLCNDTRLSPLMTEEFSTL